MLTYALIRAAKARGGFDSPIAGSVVLCAMFSLDMGAVIWLLARITAAS